MSGPLHFRLHDMIVIAEPGAEGTYEATLYPALPRIEVGNLPQGEPSVMNKIHNLRVDTVNACNLDCVFCHSDFSARAKHLTVEQFGLAISIENFGSLKKITMGCAYEPLMGRHFDLMPSAIASWKGLISADIVTNGVLLDRRDLEPWVQFGLDRLYVSVYSHLPDLYEGTGRGAARFERISANLKEVRRRYPNLAITLVNPLSKSNDVDLPAFCSWAFDEIGADVVDLRRAFFTETPSPGYPAYTYTTQATEKLGRSPWLDDDEWRRILESCTKYMDGSQKRTISVGGRIDYDSILLARTSNNVTMHAA